MRCATLLRLSYAAVIVGSVLSTPTGVGLQRRQDVTDTSVPSLTTNDGQGETSPAPTSTPTNPSSDDRSDVSSSTVTDPPETSSISSTLASAEATSITNTTTSTPASSITRTAPASTPTNGTIVDDPKNGEQLPIRPRITPAFSIGGIILILSGVVYNLVGVKNKWIQISFSTAYLASLSVTVLINYVMSPPVSDGIQGAYFVGIFMTGVIFGAGSLISKEVTEGFGCLLGGFCLSMWFLTLKAGGLITNQTGKGIFIAVFCVVVWSFSFSHYTRAYALIGSTAFSGATAFTLGIDCFSRAGLKEFWFYLWGLNDDLFPLETFTYPITRGIRVEIIVIVLATIIGVISQIKLWKIVRDRQKKKEDARKDDERRKDVVEQVLGRELERRNDRDRANWEKQYGNTLQSKRSTILWSDAHPDKSYTHIQTSEKRSSSSESLEMAKMGGRRHSQLKRQSSAMNVEAIPEEQEEQDARTSFERKKALTTLQNSNEGPLEPPISKAGSASNPPPEVIPLPLRVPLASQERKGSYSSSVRSGDSKLLQEPKSMSKRRSLQSLLSLSPRMSGEQLSTSESQEALVLPSPNFTRPSSIAATLDEENDLADLTRTKSYSEPPTPKIVISPAASFDDLTDAIETTQQPRLSIAEVLPSPPALSISFDFDPEELSRSVEKMSAAKTQVDASDAETRLSHGNKSSSASESEKKQASNSFDTSNVSTGQTSEILTKGALDQVPSQVSNVVLSYRTNEWAKHISTAEVLIFDEPETIDEMDNEAPTQLALPTKQEQSASNERPLDDSRTLTTSSKPPPPHVVASSSGQMVANVRPLDRSNSQESNVVAAPASSTLQGKSIRSSSKGKRASFGPSSAMKKNSLATTPIDENTPSQFKPSPVNYVAVAPQRMLSSTSLASVPEAKQGVAQPGVLNRASSYSSVDDSILPMSRSSRAFSPPPAIRSETRLSNYDSAQPKRSDTRLSNHESGQPKRSSSALGHLGGFRSETRLSNNDSRQPQKRELNHEAHKREQLLADWRMSQQQGVQTKVVPKMGIDTRRAQMLLDKEHKCLMEDQAKAMKQQKELQIDQVMRRPDMQEAHREAMRKMQAKATK